MFNYFWLEDVIYVFMVLTLRICNSLKDYFCVCPTIWILWRSLSAHHHWVKWHQMIYLTRCWMRHAVFWFWNLQLLETAGMPNDLNLVKKFISTPSLAEMTSDDTLNKMLNAACGILILIFTAVGNCRNAQWFDLVKKFISTPSLGEMTSDDILNKMLNAACSILILKFTAVGNCRNAQRFESCEEDYQHTIIGWNDIRWYT